MSDITVTFKNETILTMDASGSKDLLTQGKYCEDDISITYVKPSGGAISTSVDAIRAYLESNGFVCSEFAVQTPASGDYFSVPHSLGRVPDLVFAFNKDLFIEHFNTGYQLGCASNGNYGADNNNNRTYHCSSDSIDNALLYTDCLKKFPLTIARSAYDFCREASASSVTLRNKASTPGTHMLGTTWILAVK